MTTKTEKAILVLFLALTVSLATFLSYTLYVWVGVAILFRNFNANVTINKLTLLEESGSPWIDMKITITNSFQGSFIKLYVSVSTIYANGTRRIPLFSRGLPIFAGTLYVANLEIPSLESRNVTFHFSAPSDSVNAQTLPNTIFTFYLLATTLVNRDQMPISFNKTYTGGF